MKHNLITVARNDIEMISKIESIGTWEEERWLIDKHHSFDIWCFNGQYYKIYKDSEQIDND